MAREWPASHYVRKTGHLIVLTPMEARATVVSLIPPDPEGITMAPRSRRSKGDEPMSDDEFLASVRIGPVPTPGRSPRGYHPPPPKIPGLLEMVWESYTTGEFMVIQVPPGKNSKGEAWTEVARKDLLKAKNILNTQHRDEGVDIRGLEKADVEVVDPDDVQDPKERAALRKVIEEGMLGVRFMARPPALRGIRAKQAKERGTQTRFPTKREQEREAKRQQRSDATKSQVQKVRRTASRPTARASSSSSRLSPVAEDPFRR